MVINQKNLVDSGYSQFDSNICKSYTGYIKSYQKEINDENGIKYFITIDFYNLNKIDNRLGVRFQTHVQFNLKNGFTFNVEGLNNEKITVEELELFYEKIWTTMNCDYYE